MSSTNYIFIPELNYRFSKYWLENAQIPLKEYMKIPEYIETGYKDESSILRLLFDNNYASYENVNYKFREYVIDDLPKNIIRRLKSSTNVSVQPFVVCENDFTTAVLLYDFEDDESEQLKPIYQKLLDYRKGETVSLDDISYEYLSDNLDRMVYIYLNLCVNGLYDIIDVDNRICDDTDFELYKLYEIYLMNEVYSRIKIWGVFMNTGLIELRPVRVVTEIPYNFDDMIYITEDLPHDTSEIKVYLNGEQLSNSTYTINSETSSTVIQLDQNELTYKQGDFIVVEYYTNQSIVRI